MSLKYAHIVSFIFIIGLLSMAAVASAQSSATAQPSQIDPGDVKGAVVTLYYYDPVTGGKGAIVPLPDGQNPQEVIWDETKAAPGTYTFYKVPQGNYYVEAVHGNHTWFALVTVDQGTSTANVAIPPYNDTGFLATPSPQATPSTAPTGDPFGKCLADSNADAPGHALAGHDDSRRADRADAGSFVRGHQKKMMHI